MLTKRLYNQIKDQKAVVIATLNAIHNACCITDNSDNKTPLFRLFHSK